MKIAIIGSRGIPNNYGGFESFTEYFSVALAKEGHKVIVSCEYVEKQKRMNEFNGVSLFYFPFKQPKSGILRKIYETLYDGYSLIVASKNSDIVYMLGYTASVFFFIPKLFKKKLFVNPDGMEFLRNKYNAIEKLILKITEHLMVLFADEIIADSNEIKKYLDKKYELNSKFIPYGVSEVPKILWNSEKLPDSIRGKITPENYWLVIARLEPENNIHTIVEAYLKSTSKKPLLIVGNFGSKSYKKQITDNIKSKQAKEIILTGGIYDRDVLNMLRQNSFGYFHGHSVGGTNPSLLEAMSTKQYNSGAQQ